MKFKHSFLPVFGFMKKMKSHTLILLLLSTSILSQGQLPSMEDKIEGLLIGSAIGDAAGLPVEFVNPPIRSIRTTTSEKVSEEALEELAVLYQLTSYPKEAEPFAQ